MNSGWYWSFHDLDSRDCASDFFFLVIFFGFLRNRLFLFELFLFRLEILRIILGIYILLEYDMEDMDILEGIHRFYR